MVRFFRGHEGSVTQMKKEMTPAELEVMRAVWKVIEEGNVANTRTVRKKVNERRAEKLYGQVIYSHIEHLQEKGYVEVRRTEEAVLCSSCKKGGLCGKSGQKLG